MALTDAKLQFKSLNALHEPPKKLAEQYGSQGYMDHSAFYEAMEKYSHPRLERGIVKPYKAGPNFTPTA